jgi:hypothetical protein
MMIASGNELISPDYVERSDYLTSSVDSVLVEMSATGLPAW